MKEGSVIADVAIDQGGCVETARPTTHRDPVYDGRRRDALLRREHAGRRAVTSTKALTNATLRTWRRSRPRASRRDRRDRALARGVNVLDGKVTYEAVAEAHGLSYTPLEDVLPLAPFRCRRRRLVGLRLLGG
jgi:alanine dehydrogenase